jgi:ribosomal protein L12E/L44/L45/RPP1/RPP2
MSEDLERLIASLNEVDVEELMKRVNEPNIEELLKSVSEVNIEELLKDYLNSEAKSHELLLSRKDSNEDKNYD